MQDKLWQGKVKLKGFIAGLPYSILARPDDISSRTLAFCI